MPLKDKSCFLWITFSASKLLVETSLQRRSAPGARLRSISQVECVATGCGLSAISVFTVVAANQSLCSQSSGSFPGPISLSILTSLPRLRFSSSLNSVRASAEPPSLPCGLSFFASSFLLFTTGLRRGELLRLTVGDYDPRQGTLLIRSTKFHKSRLLPLAKDVCREVEHYFNIRRQHRLSVEADTPLVGSNYGGGRSSTRPHHFAGVWNGY